MSDEKIEVLRDEWSQMMTFRTRNIELAEELRLANLKNQELQHEIARLTRNEKCYGCGHSRENHGGDGCLVWVNADAHRKCLCRVWTAAERRV